MWVGLGLLLGGFAALLAGIGVSATITRHKAEQCLQDALKLKVGESTFAEVKGMARPYEGYVVIYPPDCEADECKLTFEFWETWLARVRLAPRTTFRLFLEVSKGKLISRFATFGAAEGSHDTLGAHVAETARFGPERSDFEIGRVNRGQVFIDLKPSATSEERQRAFGFNLRCLGKIGGCKDTTELLPAVWQKYGNPVPQ